MDKERIKYNVHINTLLFCIKGIHVIRSRWREFEINVNTPKNNRNNVTSTFPSECYQSSTFIPFSDRIAERISQIAMKILHFLKNHEYKSHLKFF